MSGLPQIFARACHNASTSSVIEMTNNETEDIRHMEARMKNPAMILPEAGEGIQKLLTAVYRGGVPRKTLELVHLRVSQINGCGACLDSGARQAKKSGETDERLFALAGWRHAPYYTVAERAALELGEAMTRMADRPDGVPDAIWNEAARHYDEKALAALVVWIALVNVFNRINVATGLVAGPQPWEDDHRSSRSERHSVEEQLSR